ncbi:MBL fold metallo-hydrolase [Anaerolentibacter hominis]|uniref:MBL fold metallo-hydrolase n=1 Tax=Anaerolentibacter hominis TaxID=3079009 RepID=UPI0031B83E7B
MAAETRLYYQGHGSYRLTGEDGLVLYVDPFAGDGYDEPADVILVTHQHFDHNRIDLPARKENCLVIQNEDALKAGIYQEFQVDGCRIRAVPAYNKNHSRTECVGYFIYLDGLLIYASGDTSITEEMSAYPAHHIDYALFPADGIYNMDENEARECGKIVKAAHNIPIHMKPGELYDEKMAAGFQSDGWLTVRPGEEIILS